MMNDGWSPDTDNGLGGVLVGTAVLHAQHSVVKLLVKRGADVNRPASESGVFAVAQRGDMPMLKLLVQYGVDLHASIRIDGQPRILYLARRYGHIEMVAWLEQRL